ncbi:MAG: hypothetical protein ACJ77A_11985 [Actinomycetota bacterium]
MAGFAGRFEAAVLDAGVDELLSALAMFAPAMIPPASRPLATRPTAASRRRLGGRAGTCRSIVSLPSIRISFVSGGDPFAASETDDRWRGMDDGQTHL